MRGKAVFVITQHFIQFCLITVRKIVLKLDKLVTIMSNLQNKLDLEMYVEFFQSK